MESIRAKLAQRESFSVGVWRTRDAKRRGLMLADLAQHHRFVGMRGDSVLAWLGPSECYHVQDGFPCYRLEMGGKRYELRMTLRQEPLPQRVSDVDLDGVGTR